ncbi:type II secretion system minor pseudopilin GspI [Sphingomonas sp. Ag1]|jgi:general secretion pathway protein I|uniref:type II secretion system minor pseudopilin GspI n=1 Tax=Sphingomonas sp. Ag1 TaxID=1642949 RepID=UPI0006212F7D|nr:type II secretion system minor pseudopilin GspI [Sphingomonas sp. Ag1]KKI18122.1 general secretion pathway protein GspI [Sphingomonas sp. Ag1]
MAEPAPRGGGSAGFTLIEVMVALAVFSLAALALIRLEGATIRSTALLGDTVVAQMVARNVAIDAVTSARAPALGRAAGVEQNGGRAWRWVRDVRPTGDARILRIDVAVADAQGRPLGRLTMIRPPQLEVQIS